MLVSLPDDDHAMILDGDVELVTDPTLPIADAVAAAYKVKYPSTTSATMPALGRSGRYTPGGSTPGP